MPSLTERLENLNARLEAYIESRKQLKDEVLMPPAVVMVESWFWRTRSFCQRLANRGTKG